MKGNGLIEVDLSLPLDEDFSEYLKHRSNLINIFALLCGFTFTAIIILITSFPEPGSFYSQVTLLFAAFMTYVFVFLLTLNTANIFFYIKNIPPPTRTANIISLMSVLSMGVWGLILPLIFLLFNLTLLALVTTVIWAFYFVLGIIFIWIPLEQRRKQKTA